MPEPQPGSDRERWEEYGRGLCYCDVNGGRVIWGCDVNGGRVIWGCDVNRGRVIWCCDVNGGLVIWCCDVNGGLAIWCCDVNGGLAIWCCDVNGGLAIWCCDVNEGRVIWCCDVNGGSVVLCCAPPLLKVYEDDFRKERSDKQRPLMKSPALVKQPVLVHRCNNEQQPAGGDRERSRERSRELLTSTPQPDHHYPLCPKHRERRNTEVSP
ncbi:unnamed protein product [Coregonus sp. 'balchen']|nr:unnamed protein product [Coregonus sp. 'balchen']